MKGYTFQATLDRVVARCIEKNELVRELAGACRAAGADFNEVAEHIAAEVAANRKAAA